MKRTIGGCVRDHFSAEYKTSCSVILALRGKSIGLKALALLLRRVGAIRSDIFSETKRDRQSWRSCNIRLQTDGKILII